MHKFHQIESQIKVREISNNQRLKLLSAFSNLFTNSISKSKVSMNNEGAGSQDSTLPAKKLFKRRLKRVADDDSDGINDNKVNQANEASGEPASKEHDQVSESNAANIQTAQSSKRQPGLGNSKEEDSGPQAFELKRLRRRTLKKTYNEESERSHGEPNS